jgi:hypothetical protein
MIYRPSPGVVHIVSDAVRSYPVRIRLRATTTYPTTTEGTGQARIPSKLKTGKLHSGLCGVILLLAETHTTSRHYGAPEKEKHA